MFRRWMVGSLLLVSGAAASADPIDAMLAKLDSDSFEERNAATDALAGATNIDASMIVERLRSGTLSPEASMRLMEVLRQKFRESPRGAIGIRFDQGLQPAREAELPRVIQTYKNFPACRADLVRPGDELMEVDGVSLIGLTNSSATERVMAAISSRSPGESVRLKLRRPKTPPRIDEFGNIIGAGQGAGGVFIGEIIEVDVPLGRRDQLQATQEAQAAGNELPQVAAPGQAGAQRRIVIERGEPGQPNRVRDDAPAPAASAMLSQQEELVLSNAWSVYVARLGLPESTTPLATSAETPVAWKDAMSGAGTMRPMNRASGRILPGPVKAGAATVIGLRSNPDVGRNENVLRDLAAGRGGGPQGVIIERIGGADVIRLGDGVNRVEIQVAGNNLIDQNGVVRPLRGGRARGRLVTTTDQTAQVNGAREELAAALSRVEAEIRRLTAERQSAPDDLSTTQLVDERLAELRSQWDALRAQAETVASGVESGAGAEQAID